MQLSKLIYLALASAQLSLAVPVAEPVPQNNNLYGLLQQCEDLMQQQEEIGNILSSDSNLMSDQAVRSILAESHIPDNLPLPSTYALSTLFKLTEVATVESRGIV